MMTISMLMYTILYLLIMTMFSSMIYILIKSSIHPMIMLFLLISFTLTSVIYLSKWFTSFFFSYLMFMVFIGGILITFLYLVSLTNKDKHDIKLLIKDKIMIYLSTSLVMLMIMPQMIKSLTLSFNNKIIEMNMIIVKNETLDLFISQMYNHSFKLTIISILILLFMLISVVKICSKHSGPLRQIKKT